MNRTLLLALTLTLPCCVSASAKVRVVTTTADLAAIAQAVGADKVEVSSIARGYQNPHHIDPKPSFVVSLSRADLFVRVGLDLEVAWMQPLLDASRNPRIQKGADGNVDASRGVPVLERPTGTVSRAEGDIHLYGNPHYWLDPENARIIARNIVDGLKRVDARNGDAYDRNLREFNDRVDELLKRTQAKLRPFKGTRIVAYHNTWPYFERRYGIDVVGFLEPKPGIPPSGAHLAGLIQMMKAQGVKVIVKEVYFSDAVPDRVAQQTGARVVELPPSTGGVKGTESYVELVDYIVDKLAEALKS